MTGRFTAITGFRLVTADPDRLASFYQAIGFRRGATVPIAPAELAVLGLSGGGTRLTLTLGPGRLDLDRFDCPGAPCPAGATAADTIFQHVALVTSAASAAWQRAIAAGATPISGDGPVALPASSGGVTAAKFRDPDGHPLEFLQFPPGANPAWPGVGMLGIDHSAITVADAGASLAFYEAGGLIEGKRTLNRGATQVRLDGLADVRVDVVPLNPPAMPPHLELLAYRTPLPRSDRRWRANDIAATRTVWRADHDALVPDPDGHFHQFERGG
jgi:catechol 2,3-dioxygenase-like lactoylglutathione lyase family enzyme